MRLVTSHIAVVVVTSDWLDIPKSRPPPPVPSHKGRSMDTLVGLLVLVLVIVALRKVFGALQRSASGARARVPRSDLSSVELRETLRRGQLPTPVAVSFRLQPGEECYGVVEADLEQWLEGDGTYTEKYVGWAGGLTGLAIGKAVTAAGNARRRAAATREAAERWRLIGHYRIYITSERIALEGGGGREWHELWLSGLRRVERAGSAVVLQVVNEPATRIHAAPTEYWYLLLRRLVLDELPSNAAT
jgi:hypothetical protein